MTYERQLKMELERNEAILESLGHQINFHKDDMKSERFSKIALMHAKYEAICDELRLKIEEILKNTDLGENQ